jgi:cell wall-associated NlpC family hydrolase
MGLADQLLRAMVVEEARSWAGTPFRHQARVKGVGVDCAQLVIAVGEAAGVMRIDPAAWRPWAAYGRAPNPRRMRQCLETFMIEVTDDGVWRPGDVMWCEWRDDLPMHLAILADHKGRLTMIHALSDVGKVVEHGFTAEWPARATSWWRYPGLVL